MFTMELFTTFSESRIWDCLVLDTLVVSEIDNWDSKPEFTGFLVPTTME
jgi:hypothetical protein